jgi:hypothetical protein
MVNHLDDYFLARFFHRLFRVSDMATKNVQKLRRSNLGKITNIILVIFNLTVIPANSIAITINADFSANVVVN